MASAELSRPGVERVVGYPPLVQVEDQRRREFHDALLDAGSFTPSLAPFAQSSTPALTPHGKRPRGLTRWLKVG
jgi:hypothetical protein